MVSHALEGEFVRSSSQETRSSSPPSARTQGCKTLPEDTAHSQHGDDASLCQPDSGKGCFGYTGLPSSFFSVPSSTVPTSLTAKSLLSWELCLLYHLTLGLPEQT